MIKKKNTEYTHTYVLLDAHAIIHRAYHALPNFETKAGVPTGALYGIITMLLRVIQEFNPDHIIACYDLPQKTFRHIAYEDYKGTRQQIDDVLIDQIIRSREIFDAFSIPIYDAPGFEADDVLGTLSHLLKQDKNNKVIIASGDMDTMQLIDKDQVLVYTLKKGLNDTILYDEKAVFERYGFSPLSIPGYKGLRGDTSDNIIGVKGIGEKIGTILIQKYKTIENLYKALEKKEKEISDLGITPRIIQLLKDNKEEALFSQELATIRLDAPVKFVQPKDFRETLDKNRIIELCEKYEFRSLVPRIKNLFVDVNQLPKNIKQKNEDTKKEINDIDHKYFIAVSLLNSDITKPTIEDVLSFSKDGTTLSACLEIEKNIYAEKLDYIWNEIEIKLYPIVQKMSKNGILIDKVYIEKLSQEFHNELSVIEQKIWSLAGEQFNINSPKQLGTILYEKLSLVPKDKKKTKKTSSGALSTKESELEKLKGTHEIIEYILQHREIQKLLSTYVDVLPTLVGSDGRIHAEFNQLGATTGRFSSSNPNMQNIPIKSERGKKIRSAFIASPGYIFVSCDYSQIELRIAAVLSQERYLIDSFNSGKDIHTSVAARVFHVNESDVTSEMRRKAKTINFGMLYGMGVSALAEGMQVTRGEAQEFWQAYKVELPKLTTYLERVIENAKKTKVTYTLFGRKRTFSGFNSPLPQIRAMAERMAINAPIQGTAADIIKKSMVDIDEEISQLPKGVCNLVLQVHDELIYEVEIKSLDKIKDIIIDKMKNVIPQRFFEHTISVPLDVSFSNGKNWGELK